MKTSILLLTLAAGLAYAVEGGDNQINPDGQSQRRRQQPQQNQDGQGNFRPEGNRQRGNMKPILTQDEMKKVHDAFEKVKENPAVKEAHEASAEAQKKAREISEAAAIQADPEVAPLLEKMKKAMQNRQPQNFQPNGDNQPRNQRPPDGEQRQPNKPDGGEDAVPGC